MANPTKTTCLLALATLVASATFSQQQATTTDGKTVLLFEDGTWSYDPREASSIANLEIPSLKPNEYIITHSGFSLSYNEAHEQANWVAYELTREECTALFDRTNKFLMDPKVATQTANDGDYAGSHYDRGHLAPAADMAYSATTIAESFYYSNMSPQSPGFNRGVWKRAEELVRAWAVQYGAVYIVTGPVLRAGLPTIGPNRVSVPEYYYKVILQSDLHRGIGLIIPHASSTASLTTFAVTIDSVETLTGIDFFPRLPDEVENAIESHFYPTDWAWSSTTAVGAKKRSESVQCLGTTRKGERCRNRTLNESGYCYLHEGQSTSGTAPTTAPAPEPNRTFSVQCSGTTKKGTRCRNMTTNASGRCYLH